MNTKSITWIVIITIALIIFGIWMNAFADRRIKQLVIKNQERGITLSRSDRIYKYSPSGIRYFIECIEGREFILDFSGHNGFVAGPINDKEC